MGCYHWQQSLSALYTRRRVVGVDGPNTIPTDMYWDGPLKAQKFRMGRGVVVKRTAADCRQDTTRT